MQWEKIDQPEVIEGSGFFKWSYHVNLSRALVPGGWLVLAVGHASGGEQSCSITFYPDLTHSWDVSQS